MKMGLPSRNTQDEEKGNLNNYNSMSLPIPLLFLTLRKSSLNKREREYAEVL